MKMNEDVKKLRVYAEELGPEIVDLSNFILNNPKFSAWWGGLRGQHHDFDGGLARHTREVIDLLYSTNETLDLRLDKTELFLSGLFHDAGKMFDYQYNDGHAVGEPDYVASSHKRLIHHISRSALMWSHAVSDVELMEESYDGLFDGYHDTILHNILSHHGHREWGSPVMPKTQAAWLLHLCDGISARMNDCDRLDLVHGKPKGI